ncbi:MAG: exodeoxyribonuclease VII large subunit [Candidatus Cohnella colombiensis]|uniref:Exodeoxyribonuclease 7 large subunit n=1 Tax=Candidatus Cohnella colombiensis TaxID=3121368 RepID=A0AA95EZ25_9BACL|nr:MAG: exodeoxyribonuclease VII large subunit [Cohnella sp.]
MEPSRVISIRDINRLIKLRLEGDSNLQDIWLRGEISNFTFHSSGHMYFTLKDEGGRLKSIMFASYNQRLPFVPKDGMKVLARGGISVYERDGQYQFYVTAMQPDGIGSLYLAFEQLKKKLEAEGLFSDSLKRIIPPYPTTVGVITSPTGAAVRDIITTIERRNPAVNVLLYPVTVQGTHAAPSIVKAIQAMNALGEADVLIVGRGGGSLEELWAFNEEAVVRAIRASIIPVISAVGHETDFTISDFAADLRAPTPTAAAELAVPRAGELRQNLVNLEHRMGKSLRLMLAGARERLQHAKRSPYFIEPKRSLLVQSQRLDRMQEQLHYRIDSQLLRHQDRVSRLANRLKLSSPLQQVMVARQRMEVARRGMNLAMNTVVRTKQTRIGSLIRHLDALSPLKVMARGYSLVYDAHGQKLVRTIQEVQPGDAVRVRLTDGSLDCQIWGINGEDKQDG